MKRHHSTPIRVGMWVRFHERTGIVARLMVEEATEDGIVQRDALPSDEVVDRVEVHLTNAVGENDLILDVALSEVRQAGLSDIPEPRRPDAETAARFGYE